MRIASVVEPDPIAIIGDAVIFTLLAGSFLGLGTSRLPDLCNYYVSKEAPTEPMLISLPTDSFYAQRSWMAARAADTRQYGLGAQ